MREHGDGNCRATGAPNCCIAPRRALKHPHIVEYLGQLGLNSKFRRWFALIANGSMILVDFSQLHCCGGLPRLKFCHSLIVISFEKQKIGNRPCNMKADENLKWVVLTDLLGPRDSD